jgi:hypothetical protein
MSIYRSIPASAPRNPLLAQLPRLDLPRIDNTETPAAAPARLTEDERSFLLSAIKTVSKNIGSPKIPNGDVNIKFELQDNFDSLQYVYDSQTRKGTVIVGVDLVRRMAQVDREVPGLGNITLQAAIVNEYAGIVMRAIHPKSPPGKDSKAREEASNVVSRAWIDKFAPNNPYTEEALAVWNRVSADIARGNPPYQGRSAGTAGDRALGEEVLRLLGLK